MSENGSLPEARASNPSESRSESAPSPERSQFKDRRIGLIAFGVLQLLIALAFLAMGALQLLMAAGAHRFAAQGVPPASRSSLMLVGCLYLALATVAAVLAIGSMRCRRWARALNLVLSALGLALGVVSVATLVLFWPGMKDTLEGQMGGSQPGIAFVLGCMVVGMAFVYLIIPGAFVAFYRSRHVKATCEFYDPKTRWTDRVPLPVLAGSLLLLSGGAVVLTPAMGFGAPFFGWVATGIASWIVVGILALAALVCAWGLARMHRWGWQGALALTVFNGLNALVSFGGTGLIDLFEQMRMPTEQIEAMTRMGVARWMTPMMAVSVGLMLTYYLWLGRYFKAERGAL